MNKRLKTWLIVGASLVTVGLITFGSAMSFLNWDFTKISTIKHQTSEHIFNKEFTFSNIIINSDTADVFFLPSSDQKCRVECTEFENAKHTVSVKNGALIIDETDSQKWYQNIGFSFGKTSITVYLPNIEYDSLLIKESTGDIKIPKDFKFNKIDITVSTGDIENYASARDYIKIQTSTGNITISDVTTDNLKTEVTTGKTSFINVNCKKLSTNGDTGDLFLNNVIVSGKLDIERTTGDVKFDKCDAVEISIETDTGHVIGSLLSEKVFIIETDTGKINVPKTITGGKCEIETDTGDVKIEIVK